MLDGAGKDMKEKDEKKEGTKRILFTILGILILFCSVLVIGFAIFVFEDTTNHDNSITTGTINSDDDKNDNKGENTGSPDEPINPGTGTISFSYNEASNGIELINAIPLDDQIGKKLTRSNESQGIKQGYFDFSIKASGFSKEKIKYQVYATLEDDSNMDTNFIKVYLTDENDRPYNGYNSSIPVFEELNNYSGQDKSKLLYSDTVIPSNNTVQKFRLRLWVARDYSDGSTSKTFKIKVNVKATA